MTAARRLFPSKPTREVINDMGLDLYLNRLAERVALAVGAFVLLGLLALNLLSDFARGTLSDERVMVSREVLAASSSRFSNSPRLHVKLAEACWLAPDCSLADAESHTLRAIELSPYDYRFPLLLSLIKEATGDQTIAEQYLRRALALAPNYTDVRWHLANLLLRQGKLNESLNEFRTTIASRNSLLPLTLDLIWTATHGDIKAMEAVASNSTKGQIALAQFLMKRSRAAEAAALLGSLDRNELLASPETPPLIDELIAAAQFQLARELWLDLRGAGDSNRSLIWNGGFEAIVAKELAQFDWVVKRDTGERFSLDTGMAHGGARSLRIDFTRRGQADLDGEVSQLVAVRAGVHYRLACYAKSEPLNSTEGPQVVVIAVDSSSRLAVSKPVGQAADGWQLLLVDFVAPRQASNGESAVYISIQLKPQTDQEAPPEGIVWFDDFAMSQQVSDK